jgi:hypothetical protein
MAAPTNESQEERNSTKNEDGYIALTGSATETDTAADAEPLAPLEYRCSKFHLVDLAGMTG